MLFKPCKNQSQKTTARSLQNSLIRSRPSAEASYERQKAPRRGPLAETLSPRPRPERPWTDLQFSDSLEAGLGERTHNLRPDRTPLAKRHVRIKCTQPLPQTLATRRYSAGRTTDRTGTEHSRGYLPLYSPLCSLLTLILPCAT